MIVTASDTVDGLTVDMLVTSAGLDVCEVCISFRLIGLCSVTVDSLTAGGSLTLVWLNLADTDTSDCLRSDEVSTATVETVLTVVNTDVYSGDTETSLVVMGGILPFS